MKSWVWWRTPWSMVIFVQTATGNGAGLSMLAPPTGNSSYGLQDGREKNGPLADSCHPHRDKHNEQIIGHMWADDPFPLKPCFSAPVYRPVVIRFIPE